MVYASLKAQLIISDIPYDIAFNLVISMQGFSETGLSSKDTERIFHAYTLHIMLTPLERRLNVTIERIFSLSSHCPCVITVIEMPPFIRVVAESCTLHNPNQ